MILRTRQRFAGVGDAVRSGRRGAAAAANWWNYTGVVAAYDAKNASNQASSYINLANPGTYNLTVGSAPTWASGMGWTFNGSSHYLITGITSALGWTVAVAYTGYTTGANTGLIGGRASSSANQFYLMGHDSTAGGNDTIRYAYTANFSRRDITPSSGVLVLSANLGYLDGSNVATVPVSGTANAPSLYVGAINNNGSASFHAAATIVAAWIGSSTLSSTDVAALSAAMAAL